MMAKGPPPGKPTELPRYKCHKVVQAFKIGAVEVAKDGTGVVAPAEIHASVGVHYVDADWLSRFKGDDKELGWYVLYADHGYRSWSPSAQFEDGYQLLAEVEAARADEIEEGREPQIPIDEPKLGIAQLVLDVCHYFDEKAKPVADYELPPMPEFRRAIKLAFGLQLSGGAKGIEGALKPIATYGELVNWLESRLSRAMAPPAPSVTGGLKAQLEEAVEWLGGYTITGCAAVRAKLQGKEAPDSMIREALQILQHKSPARADLIRNALENNLRI